MDTRAVAYAHYIHAYLNLEANEPSKSATSLENARSTMGNILSGQMEITVSDRLFQIAIDSLLGNAFTATGDFEKSERLQRKAIALAEAGGPATSGRLGTLYANLGSCLLWRGDLDAAEGVLRTSLMQHQRNLKCNLYALGNVYLRQGRYEEGYKTHLDVLEGFASTCGPLHHATADSCHKIGTILAMDEFSGKDLSEAE